MGKTITMNYYNDSNLKGYMESRIILEQNGLTTISEYFPNFNELKKSPTNNSKNNLPAVKEIEALPNQFTLYPNPTKGLVNVYSTEDNIKIQIINIDGKLVKERNIGKGINLINIEEFSSGFYQLRFLDKNGNLKYKQKLSVL